MGYNCYSIKIFDTTLPDADALRLEYAERGSINLAYEGADDRFVNVMASVLNFTMEVNMENADTDLFFADLFTGNENKFLVVLTDERRDKIIWQGYLMPDQYREPYTRGTFYPAFTATDGLGRLKGHVLRKEFYNVRSSVISFVSECLRFTGLDLDIYVCPTLYNEFTSRWDQMFISGTSYLENSQKKNCYDILQELLLEHCCTIMQYDNAWYIVGFTEFSNEVLTFQHYSASGALINNATEKKRRTVSASFVDRVPEISILPPIRQITVKNGIDRLESILPEDVVAQEWYKYFTNQAVREPKYWRGTTSNVILSNDRIGAVEAFDGDPFFVTGYVGFETDAIVLTEEAAYDRYISLANPPYIKAGGRLNISFEFVAAIISVSGNEGDNLLNNDQWFYDIRLAGQSIISNRPDFANRDYYLCETDKRFFENVVNVTYKLEVENYFVRTDGFLDFRLHHFRNISVGAHGFIRNLNIVYNYEDSNTEIKRRNIDFTTSKELNLFHGDSVISQLTNQYIVQGSLGGGLVSYPFVLGDLENTSLNVGRVLKVSESTYDTLSANPDRIYLLRYRSDFYQYCNDVTFYTFGGEFFVRLVFIDGYEVNANDVLYHLPAFGGDPQTNILHDYRENWSKSNDSTSFNRLAAAVGEIYHDNHPEALLRIEGTLEDNAWPFDIITFAVGGVSRSFVQTRPTIFLGDDETGTVMVEVKTDDVSDYE